MDENFQPENLTTKSIVIYNPADTTSIYPLIDSLNKTDKSTLTQSGSDISLSTNKVRYTAREQVDVTIKSGSKRREFNGIASVSVRLFEDSLVRESLHVNPINYGAKTYSYNYPKERFIYPAILESLKPFQKDFSLNQRDNKEAHQVNEEFKRAILVKEITNSYDLTNETTHHYLKLPSDITFIPDQYEGMESMAEFLKEVVPQVKVIRKKRGQTQIRVRNNENLQNVYFFKESPLFIVDGYVVTDLAS